MLKQAGSRIETSSADMCEREMKIKDVEHVGTVNCCQHQVV